MALQRPRDHLYLLGPLCVVLIPTSISISTNSQDTEIDVYTMISSQQLDASNRSFPILPSELWLVIFTHATSLEHFLGSRWSNGYIDSIDGANHDEDATARSFNESLKVKKAVSLVCRDWNRLGSRLIYKHLYISDLGRLRPLVYMLECSREKARSDSSTVDMGRWITHVMFLAADNTGRKSTRDSSLAVSSSPKRITEYVRRLVACCPRLEVFVDCTPYGMDDRPKSVIASLGAAAGPYPADQSHLRSLEWRHSGPTLNDLCRNHRITDSLETLRCRTFYESESRLEGHHSDLGPRQFPVLSFANLTSLDFWISRTNYAHICLMANSTLPSLTHFTLRTSNTTGALLSFEAYDALEAFFDRHGHKLRSLELRVWPGDEHNLAVSITGEAIATAIDPSTILSQCPSLSDLVLSAAWFAPHPSPSDPFHGDGISPCHLFDLAAHQPPTYWLIDTRAIARTHEVPCLSCNRPSLADSLTQPKGRSPSSIQWIISEPLGTLGRPMSRRHCTIDRHLRMILHGFKPIDSTTKMNMSNDSTA
ncbi:uncharacterized protein EI90DRAFT_3118919 [Cantharellus anzutake]|uniref:uncharacterized protein n=1 Tax=Cantharellus anzutake TaxID=1750568 RepID=UPI0019066116|nr:uncharacterized protein EI90DRAFT_3118919 [Cantharellus anzutake]KAF8337471.1 hypothetical protein EI90DRAFT_3118919 [Cantharellus anzutake]